MIGQKSFFHGGVTPRDTREKTLNEAIRNSALPNSAIVSLRQHRGAAARPLVKEGDHVHESMCIGAATGDGAAIHSPIPGVVGGFRDLKLPDGAVERAVVVNLVGSFDRTGRSDKDHEWDQLSPPELLGIIRDMGVVDMNSQAIPTHLRLDSSITGTSVQRIIINAMESEPFMSADFRLLMERSAALAEGVRIIRHISKVPSIVVALSSDYREALPLLKREFSPAQVKFEVLPAVYPQGDTHLLVKVLSGNLSPDLVQVFDVATVLALFEAVVLRKPLIERIITVSGAAVARPGNIKVRIGTPISWILEECGGLSYMPDRIICGGPFTGHAVDNIDMPITKQSRMILALGFEEIGYAPAQSCIRCGTCVRNCPVELEPVRLARLVQLDRIDEAIAEGLMDCTECGICSYGCPSRVPLTGVLREGKKKALVRLQTHMPESNRF